MDNESVGRGRRELLSLQRCSQEHGCQTLEIIQNQVVQQMQSQSLIQIFSWKGKTSVHFVVVVVLFCFALFLIQDMGWQQSHSYPGNKKQQEKALSKDVLTGKGREERDQEGQSGCSCCQQYGKGGAQKQQYRKVAAANSQSDALGVAACLSVFMSGSSLTGVALHNQNVSAAQSGET